MRKADREKMRMPIEKKANREKVPWKRPSLRCFANKKFQNIGFEINQSEHGKQSALNFAL